MVFRSAPLVIKWQWEPKPPDLYNCPGAGYLIDWEVRHSCCSPVSTMELDVISMVVIQNLWVPDNNMNRRHFNPLHDSHSIGSMKSRTPLWFGVIGRKSLENFYHIWVVFTIGFSSPWTEKKAGNYPWCAGDEEERWEAGSQSVSETDMTNAICTGILNIVRGKMFWRHLLIKPYWSAIHTYLGMNWSTWKLPCKLMDTLSSKSKELCNQGQFTSPLMLRNKHKRGRLFFHI